LDAVARCVDRISEVATQLALASVAPPHESTALLHVIEDLYRQMAAISAEQDRLRTSFRSPCLSSTDPCSESRDPRPAPGTVTRAADSHPEATPHPTPSCTNAATEPGRKIILSPAPTASRRNQRSRHYRQHLSTLQ
jgi:hypothetical protein